MEELDRLSDLQNGLLRHRRGIVIKEARQKLFEAPLAHVGDHEGALWPGAEQILRNRDGLTDSKVCTPMISYFCGKIDLSEMSS